jgi:hypothetical protein
MISSGLKNSLIGYGDVVVGQTIEIWNISAVWNIGHGCRNVLEELT